MVMLLVKGGRPFPHYRSQEQMDYEQEVIR